MIERFISVECLIDSMTVTDEPFGISIWRDWLKADGLKKWKIIEGLLKRGLYNSWYDLMTDKSMTKDRKIRMMALLLNAYLEDLSWTTEIWMKKK